MERKLSTTAEIEFFFFNVQSSSTDKNRNPDQINKVVMGQLNSQDCSTAAILMI